MYKLKMSFTLVIGFLVIFISCCETVYAQQDAKQEDLYSLTEYDFSDVEKEIKNNDFSDYFGSFEELVGNLAYGDFESDGIFGGLKSAFFDELINNKKLLVQIILLAILSASIKSFAPAFNKNQVSDIAHIIIEIMLVTLLFASFVNCCNIAFETIGSIVDIYKAIVPCFCTAVIMASGSITAGAYYESILILITFVSGILKNGMIFLTKIYFLLVCADSVSDKEQFNKAGELVTTIIKWTCRIAIIIFSSVAGIKGLINPVSDSVKKNVFYKTVKLVPGVGEVIEGVSSTVLGAGTVIKNSIGVAAIIVLLIVCAIPVIKLVVFTIMFKLTAAAIEPIADKRLVKAVNGASNAIGYLTIITLVAVSLFVLMLAIICISTNYNYAAT